MKKKKTIVSIALAAIMTVAICATAPAATPDVKTANQDVQTQTTIVTYTKPQAYTWSVPATIVAGTTDATGSVSASDVIIASGKELNISITEGLDEESKITLTDAAEGAGSNVIKAKVTFNAVSVASGATTGTTQTLTIAAPENVTIAGTYTGTLTFTAAVK